MPQKQYEVSLYTYRGWQKS